MYKINSQKSKDVKHNKSKAQCITEIKRFNIFHRQHITVILHLKEQKRTISLFCALFVSETYEHQRQSTYTKL